MVVALIPSISLAQALQRNEPWKPKGPSMKLSFSQHSFSKSLKMEGLAPGKEQTQTCSLVDPSG